MSNVTKKFLLLISTLFLANAQAMLNTTVKHLCTYDPPSRPEQENNINPAHVFFNENYPVILTNNKIKILNPKTRKILIGNPFKCFQTIPRLVKNFAFHPDGKMFAFTRTNGNAHIIEIHSLETMPSKKTFNIPSEDPCLAFSQEGSILAIGIRKNVVMRNTHDWTRLKTLTSGPNISDNVQAIAISPNNKLIAAGTGSDICSEVKLLNVKTEKTSTLRPYDGTFISGIVFINNKHLAISSKQVVTIWNVETGECIESLTDHDSKINSIACNQQGTILVTGTDMGFVKLWDTSTWKCLKTIKDQRSLYSIAFNTKGTLLATRSFGGTVMVYKIKYNYPMLNKKRLYDVTISCEQDQDQDPIEELNNLLKNTHIS